VTKERSGEPWMPAPDFSRTLRGLTINLLVRRTALAAEFAREVLGAEVVYLDPDFGVFRLGEAEWIIHADHTYDHHPYLPEVQAAPRRGAGAELRLHGCDPDRAEATARRLGFRVIAPPADMGHGLREAYIADADGYTWVVDITLPEGAPPAAAPQDDLASPEHSAGS
jgi:hypothetical protein